MDELDEVFLAGCAGLLEEECAVAGLNAARVPPGCLVETLYLLKARCPEWFRGEERQRRLDDASRRYFVERAGYDELRADVASFALARALYRWCERTGIAVTHEPLAYETAGIWRHDTREIALARWLSGRFLAQTLLHECAHAWLGHAAFEEPDEYDAAEAAVEALVEAVAAHLGLDWTIVNFSDEGARTGLAHWADRRARDLIEELDAAGVAT